MTKDQVKAVLDRVRTWPKERQEDSAPLETVSADRKGRARVRNA
jgi:hypothetical protein